MKTALAVFFTLIAPAAFAAETGATHYGASHMSDMQPMHDHPMEHSETARQTITTTGTVKKIHTDKNRLTIAHAPVPELEWPAMTMGFKATAEQIRQVEVGDNIRFEFTSEGMNNSVISITKQ